MMLIHWGWERPLVFVELWNVVCKSRRWDLNADVWRQRSPLRALEGGLDLEGGKRRTDHGYMAVIDILGCLCAALHN